MPAISPLVPSRLILNLSPAEEGRGVTTRWQPGRLRVIRFNCNLSANWSDYPRSRPPPPEQRRLITGHCFLSHQQHLLLHCDVDALLLPFPQPPTAAKNHRIQNRENPLLPARSPRDEMLHLRCRWQPGVTSVAAGIRLFARDFSSSAAPKHALPSAPVPDPNGFLMTNNPTHHPYFCLRLLTTTSKWSQTKPGHASKPAFPAVTNHNGFLRPKNQPF